MAKGTLQEAAEDIRKDEGKKFTKTRPVTGDNQSKKRTLIPALLGAGVGTLFGGPFGAAAGFGIGAGIGAAANKSVDKRVRAQQQFYNDAAQQSNALYQQNLNRTDQYMNRAAEVAGGFYPHQNYANYDAQGNITFGPDLDTVQDLMTREQKNVFDPMSERYGNILGNRFLLDRMQQIGGPVPQNLSQAAQLMQQVPQSMQFNAAPPPPAIPQGVTQPGAYQQPQPGMIQTGVQQTQRLPQLTKDDVINMGLGRVSPETTQKQLSSETDRLNAPARATEDFYGAQRSAADAAYKTKQTQEYDEDQAIRRLAASHAPRNETEFNARAQMLGAMVAGGQLRGQDYQAIMSGVKNYRAPRMFRPGLSVDDPAVFETDAAPDKLFRLDSRGKVEQVGEYLLFNQSGSEADKGKVKVIPRKGGN